MDYFREGVMTLPTIDIIAGSTQVLNFEVFDKKGNPMDLEGASVLWYLAQFGNTEVSVLEPVIGEIVKDNVFRINLTSNMTKNLSGTFVHQPLIKDIGGEEFRPAQGIINIIPQIGIGDFNDF